MTSVATASVPKPVVRGPWSIMRAAYKERGRPQWNHNTQGNKLHNTTFFETFENYRTKHPAGMHTSKMCEFLDFPDEDLDDDEGGDEQQRVFWLPRIQARR